MAMALAKMVKQSHGHEQDGQTDDHCHGQDLMAMALFSHLGYWDLLGYLGHGHSHGHLCHRTVWPSSPYGYGHLNHGYPFGHVLSRVAMATFY